MSIQYFTILNLLKFWSILCIHDHVGGVEIQCLLDLVGAVFPLCLRDLVIKFVSQNLRNGILSNYLNYFFISNQPTFFLLIQWNQLYLRVRKTRGIAPQTPHAQQWNASLGACYCSQTFSFYTIILVRHLWMHYGVKS